MLNAHDLPRFSNQFHETDSAAAGPPRKKPKPKTTEQLAQSHMTSVSVRVLQGNRANERQATDDR